MAPTPNQSIRSQVQVHTCLNDERALEAFGAGSFVGVEIRVGSSFRGWRIHEERMGSAMAGQAQKDWHQVLDSQRDRAGIGGPERPGAGKDRCSLVLRACLVDNRHGWKEEWVLSHACTHLLEDTEQAHHGGRMGNRQQPALRCCVMSR